MPLSPLLEDPFQCCPPSYALRFPHHNPVCSSPLPIRATCSASLIILGFITRIIFVDKNVSYSSLLCSLLHSSVTSFLLAPNIFLSTLFLNTRSLCSSFNMTEQVSHPYKATFKFVILYILMSRVFNF